MKANVSSVPAVRRQLIYIYLRKSGQFLKNAPKQASSACLSPDSEVGGIVLVVMLVLDLWDLGAEKRARSFGNYFVPSL